MPNDAQNQKSHDKTTVPVDAHNNHKIASQTSTVAMDSSSRVVDHHVRGLQKGTESTGRMNNRGDGRRLDSEQITWNIQMVGGDDIGSHPTNKLRICIVDSGYRRSHEDLRNDVIGWNHDELTNWTIDEQSGTFIAGIISAVKNDVGIVGILDDPDTYDLAIAKALTEDVGFVTTSLYIRNAVAWCKQVKSNVIALSTGGINMTDIEDELKQAYDDGSE